MNRRVSKPLHVVKWAARIWGAITCIAYLAAYIYIISANADQPQSAFNLITVLITIASLALAWRWELLGGILAILTGLIRFIVDLNYSVYRHDLVEYWNQNQILLVGWLACFIAPAILFVTYWILLRLRPKKRKKA
jgi:hypothetical protein